MTLHFIYENIDYYFITFGRVIGVILFEPSGVHPLIVVVEAIIIVSKMQ